MHLEDGAAARCTRTTLETCALGGRATVPAYQRRQPPGSYPNDAELTTMPAGLPHPATWASLPDTGAWSVARNCPIAQVLIAQVRYTLYTNGAASTPPSISC